MLALSEAAPLLQSPKKIFVTCHVKPDGDAIGSMLGLTLYLRRKGHQVTAVAPSEVP
jgi:phosphoesterase RecJ-like protein